MCGVIECTLPNTFQDTIATNLGRGRGGTSTQTERGAIWFVKVPEGGYINTTRYAVHVLHYLPLQLELKRWVPFDSLVSHKNEKG